MNVKFPSSVAPAICLALSNHMWSAAGVPAVAAPNSTAVGPDGASLAEVGQVSLKSTFKRGSACGVTPILTQPLQHTFQKASSSVLQGYPGELVPSSASHSSPHLPGKTALSSGAAVQAACVCRQVCEGHQGTCGCACVHMCRGAVVYIVGVTRWPSAQGGTEEERGER